MLMLALLLSLVQVSGAPDAAVAPQPPRFAQFVTQTDGLLEPTAAAWHPSGSLVVVESFASRLAFVRADGTLERRVDLRDEAGEWVWPHGVECLPDGSVLVTEQRHAQVWKLDAAGNSTRIGDRILIEPQGVEAHGDRIYVADSGHGSVLVFGADGSYPQRVGHAGRGRGLLVEPLDVAVDTRGQVWVVDAGTPKLVCFAPDGTVVREIEGYGPHEGLFARPSAIEIAGDHVWVCDRDNHRVQCFTLEGELVHAHGVHALLPHEGRGRLHYPAGLAISDDLQRAALVESSEDRVQVHAASAHEPDPLANIERDTAAHVEGGIAAGEQTLIALEPSGPDARVYDLRETVPIEITRCLVRGTKHGAAVQPIAVALDPQANIAYFADPLLSRVTAILINRDKQAPLRQDPFLPRLARLVDLNALQTVAGIPLLARPQALSFADGELWVADKHLRRVWVLNSKLEDQREWIPTGVRWVDPTGIARSGERVWVVDRKARTVRIHDLGGAVLHELHTTRNPEERLRLLAPFGVAVTADGGAWISDEASGKLVLLDSQLQVQRVVGTPGMERLQFLKPQGVCTSPDGDLWVVERGNHRVQRLTSDGAYKDVFGARLWCLPARQLAAPQTEEAPR